MDPNRCIELIVIYYYEQNYPRLRELLAEYQAWRNQGGFEPEQVKYQKNLHNGDYVFKDIVRKIGGF